VNSLTLAQALLPADQATDYLHFALAVGRAIEMEDIMEPDGGLLGDVEPLSEIPGRRPAQSKRARLQMLDFTNNPPQLSALIAGL
jgi:hypothetical protein